MVKLLLAHLVWLKVLILISSTGLAQVNGTITVGTSGDYTSIQQAVDHLETEGIDGPVTIAIEPGTYTEQVNIPEISGTSETNSITITSQTDDAEDVTIEFESTDSNENYVVRFEGSSHITLQHVTVTPISTSNNRALLISYAGSVGFGGSDNITISDNIITGQPSASSSNNNYLIGNDAPISNITIANNYFESGHGAVGMPSYGADNLTILGNSISDINHRGIDLRYNTGLNIIENEIADASSYSIQVRDADDVKISKNKITDSNQGIYTYDLGLDQESENVIAGNIVHVDRSPLRFRQSSTDPIYVVYNTFIASELEGFAPPTIDDFSSSAEEFMHLHNNIMVNYNDNYVVDNSSNILAASSHNLIYTHYYFLYELDSDLAPHTHLYRVTSLDDIQQHGLETETIWHDPYLFGTSDYLPDSYQASNGADPAFNSFLDTDFNNDPRDATSPSIGAIEFTQAPNPLTATEYSVGSGQDFEDLHDAVQRLQVHGLDITGNELTFNIEPGLYEGRYILNTRIFGAGGTTTIRFANSNPGGGDVELVYDEGDNINYENYVFRLTNQLNLHFENLYMANISDATASITGVVEIRNSHNLLFDGNIFEGSDYVDNDQERFSLIQVLLPTNSDFISSNLEFTDNEFREGATGIWVSGSTSGEIFKMENITITGNDFDTGYRSVYLRQIDNVVYDQNTAVAPTQHFVVELQEITGSLSIVGNDISVVNNAFNNTTSGVQVFHADLDAGSVMANNIVRTYAPMANTNRYAARIQNVSSLHILNNTFITHTDMNISGYDFFAPVRIAASEDISLVSNIFYDETRSRAADLGSLDQYTRLDYNNYFTNGSVIADLEDIEYLFLEELQNDNAVETNGFNAYPFFDSIENPLPESHVLYENGDDEILNYTTEDITGSPRNAGSVNIGALEYTIAETEPALGGTYSVGTSADYPSLSDIFEELMKFGIDDDITIEITNEIIDSAILYTVPGLNSERSLTMQSASGRQTIRQTSGYEVPYTLAINGNRNVTLNNLYFRNFSNDESADYLIQVQGRTENIHIHNNIFRLYYEFLDDPAFSGTHIGRDPHLSAHFTRDLNIYNNTMHYGNNGIDFGSGSHEYYRYNETEYHIYDNEILEFNINGIQIGYGNNITVENNRVRGRSDEDGNGLRGIHMAGPLMDNTIRANRVTYVSSGILFSATPYISSFYNDFDNRIYNNTVVAESSALIISIYGAKVKHNQFIGTGSNMNTSNVVIDYSTFGLEDNLFYNNIVVNRAGGPLIHARETDFGTSDYNVFYSYSSGGFFTGISLNNTFNEWVANIEQDANSMFLFPNTVNATAGSHPMLKNGVPVDYITEDINGNPRDPMVPVIGPYEVFESEYVTDVEEGADQVFELNGSPIRILGDFNEAGEITLEYIAEEPETTSLPTGIETIAPYYWKIESTISADNLYINIPLNIIEGVVEHSDLIWLKRDDEHSAWENLGNASVHNHLQSDVSFDSFSQFAIASTNPDNTFTNEFLAEIEVSGQQGWRMLSSPYEHVTFANLLSPLWTQGIDGANSEGGTPNVLHYNEQSGDFEPVTSLYNAITSGQGFITYIFTDDKYNVAGTFPKTLVVTGEEPGDVEDIALTFTDRGTPDNDGWNLLGNPFNSNIALSELNLESNPDIDNMVYVWDHNSSDYVAFDASNASADELSAFQGFFVKTNADEQTVDIPESAKTENNDVLLRMEGEANEHPEITLNFEGSHSRELSIRFHDHGDVAKNAFDAYRLRPMDLPEELVYFQLNDIAYSIKTLSTAASETIRIPLHVESKSDDELALHTAISGLPDDWEITLQQRSTGTSFDILESNTISIIADNLEAERFEDVDGMMLPLTDSASNYELVITPGTALSTGNQSHLPDAFALSQNYPNPFNPTTVINYQLPVNSEVRLEVFDILGRRVALLVNGQVEAGYHNVEFNAARLATGMYIYRLQAGDFTQTHKMMLIK